MLSNKGFTLVEVLLATVIGTILIGGLAMAIMGGQQAAVGIEQKVSVQEDVRAAVNVVALELAMASFNPLASNTIWMEPTACTAVSAHMTYKGIQAATDQSITIEMDANQNGVIQKADSNEIITYAYDDTNQMITKNSNCTGAISFIGDDPTKVSNTQRNVVVMNYKLNPTIPIFRYFDGTGAEITVANLPARIPQIRRIDITLAVQSVVPDMQGQTRTTVHSTSVIPRNHAIPAYF